MMLGLVTTYIFSLWDTWLPVFSVTHRRYHPGMEGPAAPSVTPAQVLDGLRAAYAYCRAMEVLRGGLERTERAAFQWCLLADGEFAAAWEESTKAQRDEASDLLAEIAAYVEPAGRRRRRPAGAAPVDSARSGTGRHSKRDMTALSLDGVLGARQQQSEETAENVSFRQFLEPGPGDAPRVAGSSARADFLRGAFQGVENKKCRFWHHKRIFCPACETPAGDDARPRRLIGIGQTSPGVDRAVPHLAPSIPAPHLRRI